MSGGDPKAEIKAMSQISETLAPLEESARSRVLKWAVDHFRVQVGLGAALGTPSGSQARASQEKSTTGTELAELFAAANPETDSDKALVVAYWLQFVGGSSDLDSQTINTELKHLGHGVKNITWALTALGKKKPQLVMQTRKSGAAKQARKKYKVTAAGKTVVETMVEGRTKESQES